MAQISLRRSKEEMVKRLKTEMTHITLLSGYNLGDTISSEDLAQSTPDRRGTVKRLVTTSDNNSFRVTNSIGDNNALMFGAIGGISFNNVSILKQVGSRYTIVAQENVGSQNQSTDRPVLINPFSINII